MPNVLTVCFKDTLLLCTQGSPLSSHRALYTGVSLSVAQPRYPVSRIELIVNQDSVGSKINEHRSKFRLKAFRDATGRV